jgi:hypothetical protein
MFQVKGVLLDARQNPTTQQSRAEMLLIFFGGPMFMISLRILYQETIKLQFNTFD